MAGKRAERIDAHQHFWNPARGDYGWMPKDDATLCRSYLPSDLAPQLVRCEVDRTILVQAAPTLAETEYLLGLADGQDWIAGVVGWIDFEDPDSRTALERLAAHPKLVGIRPMIQDIPDRDWMLRGDIARCWEALAESELCLDALGRPEHLENFHHLLRLYPQLRVAVDHGMKPRIGSGDAADFDRWADGMARIASDTAAFCKLSGLVTEAGPEWTPDDLRPYAAHILECFGPGRVMWGSDWPVCRLRCEYETWHAASVELASDLLPGDREKLFGETARIFYRV